MGRAIIRAAGICAALIVLCGSLHAQYKPVKGDWATELSIEEFNPDLDGGVNVRWFLSDKTALRIKVDYNEDHQKTADYPPQGASAESKASTMTVCIHQVTFLPGIEFHFGDWERTSLYAGFEAGYGTGGSKVDAVNVNYVDGDQIHIKTDMSGFRAAAFTGIDFYITRNLYLGAELGLAYAHMKQKPTKSWFIQNGNRTDSNNKNYSTQNQLGLDTQTGLRLGWKF